MSETKNILKYKREHDCWLCGECDAENKMSIINCAVCGSALNEKSVILKAWSEEYERQLREAAARKPDKEKRKKPPEPEWKPDDMPVYEDDYGDKDKGSSVTAIVWFTIAVFILVVLVTAYLYNA